MEKGLVIVESPTKARTINRILGDSYSVISSMGHIRDLPQKNLGVDIKKGFVPTYEPNEARKGVITKLLDCAKKNQVAFLATDPDREGEAIAWHLGEMLKDKNSEISIHRVTFHEITKQAISQAFANPGVIDMNLVNAQQARRILDRLVGYQVSPLLWKQVGKNAKSAGRVQSVALRLICEREHEIVSFVPKEYWNFKGIFKKESTNESFSAKLHQVDGKKVEIPNAETSALIFEDINKGKFLVSKVSTTPKQKRPGPPFITSTLQQAASTNLRFSTKQTMMVAQQLYEGIDTGSGPTGLITYMRTDSVAIANEARDAAQEFIINEFGKDYVPNKPNLYKSKKSAQEAHEAIRPTEISLTPQKAEKFLDANQLRLYRLIWNRFIASQMAASKYKQYLVEISSQPSSCDKSYMFRAISTETTFPGYLKVYNLKDVESEDKEETQTKIPPLTEGEKCDLDKLEKEQKFTEPLPRFSEGALVRELENNGVGRPSTYSATISTLQLRKYVFKEKGRLFPSSLGITVCDYLVKNMPKLFGVNFTAEMENELDVIEQGKIDWKKMLESFYGQFSDWVTTVKKASEIDSNYVQKIISIFPDNFEWNKPETIGPRVFDDGKFFNSLKDQLEKGKKLTEKQWKALLTIALKNKDKLPEFQNVVSDLEIQTLCEELQDKLNQQNEKLKNQKPPDEVTLKICAALEKVKEWEKSVGRGKRVYDDLKFFTSLSQQAKNGRTLSEAQMKALKNLLVKYKDQIKDFDRIIEKDLGAVLGENQGNGKMSEDLTLLFSLSSEIKDWKESEPESESEPSDKRKFDEKKFLESLENQFKVKKNLSKRQIYSLKRILKNYQDQISDYESRIADLSI